MRTRLLLEDLKRQGLVRYDRKGTRLTDKGLSVFRRLAARVGNIDSVEAGRLALDKAALAAHVRGMENARVIELRDEAIRAGASGIIMLEMTRRGLVMPPSRTQVREYKQDLDRIAEAFGPAEGDSVIVSFGRDAQSAGDGLWAALSVLTQATVRA
jgi:hypothetical protein